MRCILNIKTNRFKAKMIFKKPMQKKNLKKQNKKTHANSKHKKAEILILLADKICFKKRKYY